MRRSHVRPTGTDGMGPTDRENRIEDGDRWRTAKLLRNRKAKEEKNEKIFGRLVDGSVLL